MSFTLAIRPATSRLASSALPQVATCSLRALAPRRAMFSTMKTSFRPQAVASTRGSLARTFRASPLKTQFCQQSRGYNQGQGGQYAPTIPMDSQSKWRKIAVSAAIFGGTLAAINLVFNMEGRTDGGMPTYEREYLNDTFLHTGLGVGIIGLTARQMINTGFVYRIMMTSPWVVAIGGLAASFGSMIATRSIEPENYVPKYACWTLFNVTQAALVAPMLAFVPGAIVARAGLYTVAMMGGLSIVGATARQDKYLYIGGPLMAGACVVLASGLAPLVIPTTAARTLAMMDKVWLYGGLTLFGGFTLYDVQKVLAHARMAQQGHMKRDAVNESISLELDFLNIFIRMVQILMMRGGNNKK